MSDDITNGLDLLGDWLDAKGYTEEAGLCTRAMDEINKLRAATTPICVGRRIIGILAKEGAWTSENGASVIAADELFQRDPYEEIEKLRAALNPFAVMAMLNNMKEYETSPDECVMTAGSWGNKPLLTFRLGDLRAAAAALKETGE